MVISDSIKYVGVDDREIDLFESQYVVENGLLQDVPDVTTFSTGTEPNRRVVVSYSKYSQSEED